MTSVAVYMLGTAVVVSVKTGLTLHEHFKGAVFAAGKVQFGCTSFLDLGRKNAADFFQNLRRRHMRKGMLPYGNIPFVAWLFSFELTCLPSVLEKTLILLDFSMFSYVRGA